MSKRLRGFVISLVVGFPAGWVIPDIIEGNFILVIATIPLLVWMGMSLCRIWLIIHDRERYKKSWLSRI